MTLKRKLGVCIAGVALIGFIASAGMAQPGLSEKITEGARQVEEKAKQVQSGMEHMGQMGKESAESAEKQAQEQPATQPMEKAEKQQAKPPNHRQMMLKNIKLTREDPQAILALKDQLELTDEQVTMLNGIIAEARQKTAQLNLTDQQKAMLTALPEEPKSVGDMMKAMYEKDYSKEQKTDKGDMPHEAMQEHHEMNMDDAHQEMHEGHEEMMEHREGMKESEKKESY